MNAIIARHAIEPRTGIHAHLCSCGESWACEEPHCPMPLHAACGPCFVAQYAPEAGRGEDRRQRGGMLTALAFLAVIEGAFVWAAFFWG